MSYSLEVNAKELKSFFQKATVLKCKSVETELFFSEGRLTAIVAGRTVALDLCSSFDGCISVDYNMLSNLVKVIKDKVVKLELSSEGINLHFTGSSTFLEKRKLLHDISKNNLQFVEVKRASKDKGVVETLKKVKKFLSKDGLRPVMCEYCLSKEGNVVATNANILYYGADFFEKNEREYMIIGDSSKVLNVGEDFVLFEANRGDLFFLKIKTGNIEYTFPECPGRYVGWKDVIPTCNDIFIDVNKKELISVLELIKTVWCNKSSYSVKFTIGKESLSLSCKDVDNDIEFEKTIEAKITSERELEIGFRCDWFLDVISVSENEIVNMSFQDPSRACIVDGNCIIMPHLLM